MTGIWTVLLVETLYYDFIDTLRYAQGDWIRMPNDCMKCGTPNHPSLSPT